MKKLVRKIIWQGQQRSNFLFAGFGFLLGFLFLLLSVQLYDRVYAGINRDLKEGELSRYIVLNKRIGNAQIMGSKSPNFSQEEVDEIAEQGFIRDIGVFTGNSFTAAITLEQFQDMQVMLPLEAVEHRFMDTIPEEWAWEQGDEFIPVVISSEFLNLYNTVLAPSMNYPRFTREFVQSYPLEVLLIGNGRRTTMPVKVVGFSDRILSGLVPENFLEWANKTYGSGVRTEFARVIAQVDDPGDPEIKKFLDNKDYETNRDQLRSTASGAVSALLSVLAFLGLLFLALATIIFLMAFELTISRARTEIDLLIQLGYTLPTLIRALVGTFVPVLLGIGLVSVLLLAFINSYLNGFFVKGGFIVQPGLWIGVWIAAILFITVVIGLSIWRIRASLVKLAR